jgi:hypothetical protein
MSLPVLSYPTTAALSSAKKKREGVNVQYARIPPYSPYVLYMYMLTCTKYSTVREYSTNDTVLVSTL